MASNVIELLIKAQDLASDKLKKVQRASADLDEALVPLKNGMQAAGIAIGIAGAASVKMAADLEQSLNVFKSVSGATAKQMELVSQRARELGKDASLPGISAAHAAEAMTELAKAGLSVNDTLAASKGVLSLAKAGNIEVAEAAQVAAQALNAFKLSGDKAGEVADALANGANASAADIHGLSLGLQQSSAVANQFGISLQDTVATLAIFANRGIQGSDAGTSLKTMLIQLANPSKQAADKMKELGFSAFDANGNFVGLGLMAVRLQGALVGLTQEQKNAALATIFGTDAFRAAAFLADSAGQKFEDMQVAIGRSGAAMDLAAAQNAGFKGALDSFISTLQTVGQDIGMKVLPPLTKLLRTLSESKVFDWVVKNIDLIVIALGTLGAMFVAVKVAIFVSTLMEAVSALKKATGATTLFNAVLALNPVVLIVMAVIALIAILIALEVRFKAVSKALNWVKETGVKAWNWIKEAAGKAVDWVVDKWNSFKDFVAKVFNIVKSIVMGYVNFWIAVWSTVFNIVMTVFTAIYNTIIRPIITLIVGFIKVNFAIWQYIMQWIMALAAYAWNWIYDNVIQPVINAIVAYIRFWANVFKTILDFIVSVATSAWNWIYNNVVRPVVNAIIGVLNWMGGVIAGVWNWVAGVASSVWNAIANWASSAWHRVVSIWNGVYGFFSGIAGHIGGAISGAFNGLAGAATGAFNGVKGAVVSGINWVIDKINWFIDKANSVADKVPGAPHIGRISKLASGTPYFSGGVTMVGERGPELVSLPRGSRVMSATETREALAGAGGGATNNFYGNITINTAEAADRFFKRLNENAELAAMGVPT